MEMVELGLFEVAAEVGVEVVPRRHRALLERQQRDGGDERAVQTGLPRALDLREAPEELEDLLLFWGDFHHMRQYIQAVANLAAEEFDSTSALLLPTERRQAMQTFGTTLVFNSAEDMLTGSYAESLTRFLRSTDAAWFRDPTSVALAQRLAPDVPVRLGVDAALFVPRPDPAYELRAVRMFLGRTPAAHAALQQVARWYGDALQCPVRWLDWGSSAAFPYLFPEGNNGQDPVGRVPLIGEVMADLASAAAVVTDSYHLALVSWAWGIPCISVTSEATDYESRSVDSGSAWTPRDKRDIAASQYQALDFVLRPHEWRDPELTRQRWLRALELAEAGATELVSGSIALDVGRARAQLHHAWTDPAVVSPTPTARTTRGASSRQLRALAIVAVRDEERHIDGLIRRLVQDGLDVAVLDDGSADASGALSRRWLGHGVVDIQHRERSDFFSLQDQLTWKQKVAAELNYDWILHCDADEWMHARTPGMRLVDLLAAADAENFNVVNFEEFVFVPERPLADDEDPRERWSTYYFFAPDSPRLMRAWKHGCGLSNLASGGHLLSGDVRVYPDYGVLRHYPVVTTDVREAKYLSRRFSRAEVEVGWHGNRLGLSAGNFLLDWRQELRHLDRWSSYNFDRSCPTSHHYWETAWRTPEASPFTRPET